MNPISKWLNFLITGPQLNFFGISAGTALAVGVGAAASVGGALMKSSAASDAADSQIAASQDANAANLKINQDQLKYLRETRDQANAVQEPFRQQGMASNTQLGRYLGTATGLTAPTPKALVAITPKMSSAQKLAAQKTNAGITKQNTLALQNYQKQSAAIAKSPQYGSLMKDFGEKFNNGKDFSYGIKDFQEDPGYKFKVEQGNRDLQGRLAAMGMSNSGAAVKEGIRYNQGVADQTWQADRQTKQAEFQANRSFKYGQFLDRYNQYQANRSTKFNQLSTSAGSGQAAANTIGNNAQQYGQSAASALGARGEFLQKNAQNIGDANSYAALQSGNAWGGAANKIAGVAGNYLGNKFGG